LFFELNMKVLDGAVPGWIDIDSTWFVPGTNFMLVTIEQNGGETHVESKTPFFDDCYNDWDHTTADVAMTVTESAEVTLPETYSLEQIYPNPFNPSTYISFALPRYDEVNLSIYNILGQRVRTLLASGREAGCQTVEWDGKDDRGQHLPSGVCFYRMETSKLLDIKKMLLLK
jgi:hypothetical protein